MWGAYRRYGLFSMATVGCYTQQTPVLIKISAYKDPLNQHPVFSSFIRLFCHQHNCIVHEKAINVSESRKSRTVLMMLSNLLLNAGRSKLYVIMRWFYVHTCVWNTRPGFGEMFWNTNFTPIVGQSISFMAIHLLWKMIVKIVLMDKRSNTVHKAVHCSGLITIF